MTAPLILAWTVGALAGGTASPPPPPPPTVDFSRLPASADVLPREIDGKDHPVRARLLLDTPEVQAGKTVQVGLHLTQAKDWHTYWKSPGEIGRPTEVVWTLPGGITASPLKFPVPQRFEQEGMVSYGYDGQVLLLSELQIPADLAPGVYPLRAKVDWLVCLSSCIPGGAELEVPLTVGPVTATAPWSPLFDHYRQQLPTDGLGLKGYAVEHAVSTSALRPGDTFKVAFKVTPTEGQKLPTPSGTWPGFTPIAASWDWMLTSSSLKATPDGGWLAVLEGEALAPDPLPAADQAGALLQLPMPGKEGRLGAAEILVPLRWAAAGSPVEPSSSPLWKLAADGGPPASPPGDGGQAEPEVAAAVIAPAAPVNPGLLFNLLSAFLGGLLLNVMPCVLPVLTLKLYSLVEQSELTNREKQGAGMAYTAGILASFLALAGVVWIARSALGVELSWGSQFQYPGYVAALATIVFAFGLSLFGVFEIPTIGAEGASEASSREGLVGYFFTGVFATLLATPCSAPFLGTAVAFAFGAPPLELAAIFSAVAAGLAAPFLVVAFVPALYRFLPRPGPWMEPFKQLLGFTLLLTTAWLVGVLQSQIGGERTEMFLYFLVFVGVAAWLFGRMAGLGAEWPAQLRGLAAAGLVTAGAGWTLVDLEMAEARSCDDGSVAADLSFEEHIPWQAFSEQRVQALAGKPVFIDFTAEWCLTCKANENTVLETSAVRKAMAEHGIVPLKADWTRADPVITEWLRRFGRAGVPFYLVLPAREGAEPIALPEVITQATVIEAFRQGARQ